MIFVKLEGRLGNQIFQYAFAKAIARQYRTIFLFDIQHFPLLLHKYFKIPLYDHWPSRIINNKNFRWLKKMALKKMKGKLSHPNNADIYELIKNINNTIYYEGYFQSTCYFAAAKEIIKRNLQIKTKYFKEFERKYKTLFETNKILTIHYRGKDYKEYGSEYLGGKGLNLPVEYYMNCLKQISDIFNYKVLVISDDIETAKIYFSELPNVSFEENNLMVDFLILTYSDILIISNSSFAWWGAYLNKKNAKVYAPKYWLGFKIKETYPLYIDKNLKWDFTYF